MSRVLVISVPMDAAGEDDVQVRIFASRRGPVVLWEDTVHPHRLGRTEWCRLVLGRSVPLPDSLLAEPVRYLSTRPSSQAKWSPRVPVDLGMLRLDQRVAHLESRMGALEASRASDHVLGVVRDALDEHERRLGRLERSNRMRVGRLSALARSLALRLDRLDQDDGRVVRLEDELEDLVGPDGDVVDLEDRLAELERAVAHRLRGAVRDSEQTKDASDP